MNEELRNALNTEIEKSETTLKEFLTSSYFKDTLKLIIKVNKLNETQAEAFELELTMYILGINDHVSLEEAFRAELGQDGQVASEGTVRQLLKDCESYVLNKIEINKNKLQTKEGDEAETNNAPEKVVLNIKTESPTQSEEVNNKQKLHDMLYGELKLEAKKVDEVVEVEPEIKEETKQEEVVKKIDYYRELVDEDDKKLKF